MKGSVILSFAESKIMWGDASPGRNFDNTFSGVLWATEMDMFNDLPKAKLLSFCSYFLGPFVLAPES